MIPAIRLTWRRSESSKRSTGVARDFSTGSPSLRMNDIAATRRASTSGSSGAGVSSSAASASTASASSWGLSSSRAMAASLAARLLRVHVHRERHGAVRAAARHRLDGAPHRRDRRLALA
jgi:hypothetical protein